MKRTILIVILPPATRKLIAGLDALLEELKLRKLREDGIFCSCFSTLEMPSGWLLGTPLPLPYQADSTPPPVLAASPTLRSLVMES